MAVDELQILLTREGLIGAFAMLGGLVFLWTLWVALVRVYVFVTRRSRALCEQHRIDVQVEKVQRFIELISALVENAMSTREAMTTTTVNDLQRRIGGAYELLSLIEVPHNRDFGTTLAAFCRHFAGRLDHARATVDQRSVLGIHLKSLANDIELRCKPKGCLRFLFCCTRGNAIGFGRRAFRGYRGVITDSAAMLSDDEDDADIQQGVELGKIDAA